MDLQSEPSFFDKLVYTLIPIRRQTVCHNMGIVFGNRLSAIQIKKLAQCFYGHMARLILENVTSSWMDDDAIRRRVRVVGHEFVIKAAEQKKGVLLLTGHFGNWEFAPVGTVLQFEMFRGRFHVLRKLLANKGFERLLFRRFYNAGLNVIPKQKNALDQVLDALGKNDVVAFIMDQYARPDRDGILVDFFGKEAGTYKSLALIARQTHAPVIPAVCYRESFGRHVMEFLEPLRWIEDEDPDEEIRKNTRQYNQMLETMILRHPDQWLWFHRRWKQK